MSTNSLPSKQEDDEILPEEQDSEIGDENFELKKWQGKQGGTSSDGKRYRDATTGEELPGNLVEAARAEEIAFMQSWQVWEVVPTT